MHSATRHINDHAEALRDDSIPGDRDAMNANNEFCAKKLPQIILFTSGKPAKIN